MKKDQYALYPDDIGVVDHTASELIENFDRVFEQTQMDGLKMSIEKCPIGKHSIDFLGNTIFTAGVPPIAERLRKSLKNLKLPSSVKTLQRSIKNVNCYKQYIPRLARKMVQLHLLLRKDVPFKLSQQHKDALFEANECLLQTKSQSCH